MGLRVQKGVSMASDDSGTLEVLNKIDKTRGCVKHALQSVEELLRCR